MSSCFRGDGFWNNPQEVSMIRIVIDTGGDLPRMMIKKYRIVEVPINIRFGQDEYLENVNIDEATFYQMVETRQQIPQTSQPTPYQFRQAYDQIFEEDSDANIISIHLTSKLSGTYVSAVQAKNDHSKGDQIYPFDSGGGSGGQGFMALEAARMAETGRSVQDIMNRLDAIRKEMRIWFVLNSLKYAQMSGRVGALAASLVSVLDIKPIIALKEGFLEATERVRTQGKAIQHIVERHAEHFGEQLVNVAIAHANAPEIAERLERLVRERLNIAELMIVPLSLGVAVNLGPGTLGVIVYPCEARSEE
jgi:DegV family protein with EDD domain